MNETSPETTEMLENVAVTLGEHDELGFVDDEDEEDDEDEAHD